MLLDEQLSSSAFQTVSGVPSTLNQKLANGEIDLCPCSSIEFARHAGEYDLLEGHCIGSDGPVQSVLLFSKVPIGLLQNETVYVTAQSATSVVLLQILVNSCFRLQHVTLQVTDLPWKEAIQQGKATLLIGDNALMALESASIEYCYDLGVEWKNWTGLPFVYALWLVNRNAVKYKQAELAAFTKVLDQARDQLPAAFGRIAVAAAAGSWMTADYLEAYWRNALTYRLDERHLAGLKRYYALAFESGLLDSLPTLQFYRAEQL